MKRFLLFLGLILPLCLHAANPGLFKGAGSPEGVQVGRVGDFWINTSGGASNTLYTKKTGTATTTGWVAIGGASLWQDFASGLMPIPSLISQPLILGNTNTLTEWNNEQGVAGPLLLGRYDVSLGDPSRLFIDFGISHAGDIYNGGSDFYFDLRTNSYTFTLTQDMNAGPGPYHTFEGLQGLFSRFTQAYNDAIWFRVTSEEGDTLTVPYVLDTPSKTDPATPLLAVRNNGTNEFQVSVDGAVTTASSGTSAGAWKLGPKVTGVSVALVLTNYVEVMINGTVVKLGIVQ